MRSEMIVTEQDVAMAYRRAWFPIGRSPDFAAGPKKVTLLGETLVAYRGDDRKMYVMRNECPHRGAAMYQGRVRTAEQYSTTVAAG